MKRHDATADAQAVRGFTLGAKVQWRSQAQGSTLLKEGEVVGIIPPGERPDPVQFPALYRGTGPGYGRSEFSYVVKVGYKLYWPRTSLLEHVGPSELEHVKAKLAAALTSLRSFDPKLADHIEGM